MLFLMLYGHPSIIFNLLPVWLYSLLCSIIPTYITRFWYCLYVLHNLFLFSHTVLSHIICVHSSSEQDSSLLYPLTVSVAFVLIEGSSLLCKTRLLPSSQIVNPGIFTVFVLQYCTCLSVFDSGLTHNPPHTHILCITTLSFLSCALSCVMS